MTLELKEKVLQNIIKDCYWDSKIDKHHLQSTLALNDSREMSKLFSKIIYNSRDKLLSLKLFSQDQLKDYFADFKVTYNEKYINKHILILKALLLGEQNYIKSLEWKKR